MKMRAVVTEKTKKDLYQFVKMLITRIIFSIFLSIYKNNFIDG